MNYQANVTKFPAKNASVGFFVESETNQPAYSLPLYNAFTSIGIIPQGIINGVMTTEQGRVKPNELMILVLKSRKSKNGQFLYLHVAISCQTDEKQSRHHFKLRHCLAVSRLVSDHI